MVTRMEAGIEVPTAIDIFLMQSLQSLLHFSLVPGVSVGQRGGEGAGGDDWEGRMGGSEVEWEVGGVGREVEWEGVPEAVCWLVEMIPVLEVGGAVLLEIVLVGS